MYRFRLFPFISILLLTSSFNLSIANPSGAHYAEEAHKEFVRLISFHASKTMADSLWKEAAGNYSGSDRHYHTLEHIENFYSQLKKCRSKVADWETLVIAMVYHDVIYGSIDRRDEERSAELAVERLTSANLPKGKIEKIKALVMATKAHTLSPDNDTNYFNDADMSIVGLDREYYKRYVINVRKEYAKSPNFNSGRKM